jgi:nucleotide-binding universal stress UspA family protein
METTKATNGKPRVVVGVDCSEPSIAALRWAADTASHNGAELVAVRVYQPDDASVHLGRVPEDEQQARTELSEAVARGLGAAEAATVTTRVTPGSPARELAALSNGADLLVVGSHGHGRIAGALLGSTAQDVIGHAACPVVVVPSGSREAVPAGLAGPAAARS